MSYNKLAHSLMTNINLIDRASVGSLVATEVAAVVADTDPDRVEVLGATE